MTSSAPSARRSASASRRRGSRRRSRRARARPARRAHPACRATCNSPDPLPHCARRSGGASAWQIATASASDAWVELGRRRHSEDRLHHPLRPAPSPPDRSRTRPASPCAGAYSAHSTPASADGDEHGASRLPDRQRGAGVDADERLLERDGIRLVLARPAPARPRRSSSAAVSGRSRADVRHAAVVECPQAPVAARGRWRTRTQPCPGRSREPSRVEVRRRSGRSSDARSARFTGETAGFPRGPPSLKRFAPQSWVCAAPAQVGRAAMTGCFALATTRTRLQPSHALHRSPATSRLADQTATASSTCSGMSKFA